MKSRANAFFEVADSSQSLHESFPMRIAAVESGAGLRFSLGDAEDRNSDFAARLFDLRLRSEAGEEFLSFPRHSSPAADTLTGRERTEGSSNSRISHH